MANPVTWFEIIGGDAIALQKFYADVFAWKLSPPMAEMGNYSMLDHEGHGIPGGIGGDATDSARVSVYIECADPQAQLDKAVAAGATMLMPVTQITPETTIAMFKDPAGNTMGLLKGDGH
jgi:predicted enzyme related to lactoylglutathione lyase